MPRLHRSCDSLILTGSVGSGHVSVAKAISEALHRNNGARIRIEIVDLLNELKNLVTAATKKIYLGSLKISPKLYAMLFAKTETPEWPLKLLDALSAPFMEEKFLNLLKNRRPRLLISTFPVWDILARRSWQEYCGGKFPFVSVVTDSIAVHSAWIHGKPDYFIVGNEDTKIALRNRGVVESRIKVFGYPVSEKFSRQSSSKEWREKLNLSPRKKTLLLLLGNGLRWLAIKKILKAIQKSRLLNIQLVIVAAGEKSWETKLKRHTWPWETVITGWTREIHAFLQCADIVITKAGGATVMECIAAGKPMVIFKALAGQETGNAALVQKYNLGAILYENAENFDAAVEYIFTNAALIQKNLAAQQHPRAADDTAKFLTGLLQSA